MKKNFTARAIALVLAVMALSMAVLPSYAADISVDSATFVAEILSAEPDDAVILDDTNSSDVTITGGVIVEIIDDATVPTTGEIAGADVAEPSPEPSPEPVAPSTPAPAPVVPSVPDNTVNLIDNMVPLAAEAPAKKTEKIVEFNTDNLDDGYVQVKLVKKFDSKYVIKCAVETDGEDKTETYNLKYNKWVKVAIDAEADLDYAFTIYQTQKTGDTIKSVALTRSILRAGTDKIVASLVKNAK